MCDCVMLYTKATVWSGYRFSSFIAFSARITMSFRIIGTIGVPHSDKLENASTVIMWWQTATQMITASLSNRVGD